MKIHRQIAFVLGVSVAVGSGLALAESVSRYRFKEVWAKIHAKAPDLVAAQNDWQAAEINRSRLSRHWYPRVFAEGKAYSTNDPALNFMSLLGQRRIGTSDFAPLALNQPGSHFYQRGTLGLDLPLYEGGSKQAAAESAKMNAEAMRYGKDAAELKRYVDAASAYASLLVWEDQKKALSNLLSNIDDTLSRYQIGSKGNPVGYSGLLGLKNLKNRLEGLLAENRAKRFEKSEWLRVSSGDLPGNWTPSETDIRSFIERYLSRTPVADSASLSERMYRASAEAIEKSKSAETARFLPKVGLFGTGDLYSGNRNTATSYTAGAYLQWDLFSAPNAGAVRQVEHQAAAAQARAEAEGQRSNWIRTSSTQAIASLDQNLKLMDESMKLLEEQTTTARGLFRNGSISALQLVEVLARRADLLVSRAEAQLALAQAKAQLMEASTTEIVVASEEVYENK